MSSEILASNYLNHPQVLLKLLVIIRSEEQRLTIQANVWEWKWSISINVYQVDLGFRAFTFKISKMWHHVLNVFDYAGQSSWLWISIILWMHLFSLDSSRHESLRWQEMRTQKIAWDDKIRNRCTNSVLSVWFPFPAIRQNSPHGRYTFRRLTSAPVRFAKLPLPESLIYSKERKFIRSFFGMEKQY